MKHRKPQKSQFAQAKYILAGGSMLALVGVLADLKGVVIPKTRSDICQEVVQPNAVLSREQLSQLLNVPERSHKQQVKAIVQEPYCKLPGVEIRAGATAEREAYPLAFDPDTWFIVLYEGQEYAGYDFSFRR